MRSKKLHPITELFLILLLVSSLVIMSFAGIIIGDKSGGDFDYIRNNYYIELNFAVIICALCSMCILYFMFRNMRNKNAAKLHEDTPIYYWTYNKYYWEGIKAKEIKKEVLLHLAKLLLIWIPIGFFLYFIWFEEQIVSIILMFYIIVFTIPIIPFTTGEFIRRVTSQFFQDKYEVRIFMRGLTINNMYYPYRSNGNVKIILENIEEINGSWKFKAEKRFYSYVSGDGDSGTKIRRAISICVPIPYREHISIDVLKEQLEIND